MILSAHLLKLLFPTNKSNKQLQKSHSLALMLSALFLGGLNSEPASAFVGATEFTQIANNIQLVLQYAKQVQQYENQLQQYQLQLQNLAQNPASSLGANTTQVIQGVGSIMSAENSIGGTLSQIDANFAKTYGNQMAGSFADKFKVWTGTSVGTLGAALKAAGLHRDAYASDADALQALYNRSQSSTGTVAAVQQLSELTAMQIQQTQKLKDLMASQNLAASTWMMSQSNKEQAAEDRSEAVAGPLVLIPTGATSKSYTPLKIKTQ